MRNMKDLGSLIATNRKKADMTQEALAAKLGITPQAVSKWENGIGYPDVTLFPAIAKVLEISIEELFFEQKLCTVPQFPQEHNGMPFIFSMDNKACYSSKTTERVDGEKGIAYFTDGSTADITIGIVYNRGEGEIVFLEVEQARECLCADAPTSVKEKLPPFSSLSISSSFACDIEVIISKDKAYRLEGSGSPQFIAALSYPVDNDQLTVSMNNTNGQNNGHMSNKLLIYVGFEQGKNLRVTVNGSGSCRIEPSFEESELGINGSGTINGKDTARLRSTINGSGVIELNNAYESCNLSINGSGVIDLSRAGKPDMRINGSGAITAKQVTDSMTLQINGSADITASGEIEKLHCTIRGSGEFGGRELTVTDAEFYLSSNSEVYIGRIKGTSVEKIEKGGILSVARRG